MSIKSFFYQVTFILVLGTSVGLLGYYQGKKEMQDERQTKQEKVEKVVDKWKEVEMNVSAYCPCSKCCGEFADGITANGYKIKDGDCFVAAPKIYPFGTEMIIPGYNDGRPVKVLDRGGAIKGNKLDLFFPSHKEALIWGRQYIKVKVKLLD